MLFRSWHSLFHDGNEYGDDSNLLWAVFERACRTACHERGASILSHMVPTRGAHDRDWHTVGCEWTRYCCFLYSRATSSINSTNHSNNSDSFELYNDSGRPDNYRRRCSAYHQASIPRIHVDSGCLHRIDIHWDHCLFSKSAAKFPVADCRHFSNLIFLGNQTTLRA